MQMILEIEYYNFAVDRRANLDVLKDLFLHMVPVEYSYDKKIYIPDERRGLPSIKFVRDAEVRCLTAEEQVEATQKALTNQVNHLKAEVEKQSEKIKELTCINEALCNERASTTTSQGEEVPNADESE